MAFLCLTSCSTIFFHCAFFVLCQHVKLYISLLFYSLLKFLPALSTWQTLSLCFTLFFRHDLLKLFPDHPKQSEAIHFLSVSVLLLAISVVAGVLLYYNYCFTCLSFIFTACKGHTWFMFVSLASKRIGSSKYLYICNLADLKSTSTCSYSKLHPSGVVFLTMVFPSVTLHPPSGVCNTVLIPLFSHTYNLHFDVWRYFFFLSSKIVSSFRRKFSFSSFISSNL